MDREKRYRILVKKVKEDYDSRKHDEDKMSNRPYVGKCNYDLQEINLWSYWQNSLTAKILILGQEWGSFIENPKDEKRKIDCLMGENFRKIDKGYSVRYHESVDDEIISATDKMLIELVNELNLGVDIRKEKSEKLFFSNLCLGYRNKGYSGGFKTSWLTADVKYLIGYDDNGEHIDGLLEIIKPEIIICLGKEVYGVVLRALGCKKNLKEFYKLLDNGENYIDVCRYDKNMRIFGMAHPGRMGIANRKSRSKHKDDKGNSIGENLQKEDWKRIKNMYDAEFKLIH